MAVRMTGIQRIKSRAGITLVELLIVIIVVGILAAIATPLYTSYITRARRADAKTALEQVRATQEMWRAEKGGYSTDLSGAQLTNTMGAPVSTVGNGYYTWGFTGTLNANTFTAQASPVSPGPQDKDGWLRINNNGVKTSEKPERWLK
jgi:type IV pilus assembly protein PilE